MSKILLFRYSVWSVCPQISFLNWLFNEGVNFRLYSVDYRINEYKTKSTVFWDITLCSPLNVNRRFGGTYRLYLQGRRISHARTQHEYEGDLLLRIVGWQRTTRRYMPKYSTLHNHRCENFKYYRCETDFGTRIGRGNWNARMECRIVQGEQEILTSS
jgi:hypothetical protein